MSLLARLKLVQSLNSFAMLLGMKPAALAYILYKLPPAQKYKSFDLKRKVVAFERSWRLSRASSSSRGGWPIFF